MADYGIDNSLMDAYSLYKGASNAGTGLLGTLNKIGGYTSVAAPVLMGMFGGVPSGKENHRRIEQARHNAMAQQAIANLPIPEGMSHQEYIKDKTPPKSPWDYAMDGIPDTDDGDYERQMMSNYFQNGDGKAKMEAFYQANPEWYTPTGERIYKYQQDADAISRMAPSGIVNPLTDEQVRIMNERGLNVQKPAPQTSSGVLPPPQEPQGALGITPDRVGWLQEGAPQQTYNGQELYAPVKKYKNEWRMS